MTDQGIGALFRAVRLRRGLRQADVAAAAGLDRMAVSRIERGHLASVSLARLRSVATALEVRLELQASWRGAEATRIVNERHSRMHELVATRLARAGWTFAAEVTFSRWGERGSIDVLAWHPDGRALLVIELKTEIPDPAGLVAQVDRYRRLAPAIARDRGWEAATLMVWVLVAESNMNRRQLARHRTMLRNAFPLDGHAFARIVRHPAEIAMAAAPIRRSPSTAAGSGAGSGGGARLDRDRAVPSGAGLAVPGGSGLVVPGGSGLAFLSNAGSAITRRQLGPVKRVARRRRLPDDPAIDQQGG